MLDALKELIAIKSVYDESTIDPDAPYGKGPKEALDWFLAKASSLGMRTCNIDNRCGYAEIGEGKSMVAAMSHLDVVPAGNGWTSDPFTLTQLNGNLYGRGVTDDKGPLIATLFALNELKDKPLKKRVRLIVGCDEERGSSCIKHYVKSGAEKPEMGFTPDANFPVINCEKNILQFNAFFNADGVLKDELLYVKAGTCYNAVPSEASAAIIKNGKAAQALKKLNGGRIDADVFTRLPFAQNIIEDGYEIKQFSVCETQNAYVFSAVGVAAHASTPGEGDNALWKIMCFLKSLETLVGGKTFTVITDNLCTPLAEDKIKIAAEDERSGNLTMSVDTAEYKNGVINLGVDIRFPLTRTKDEIYAAFSSLGATVKEYSFNRCLYIPADSKLVSVLMSVYKSHFDDPDAKPLIMGGGTYAKELPNTVAFGPVKDYESNEHGVDETMPAELFFKLKDVYADALYRLACE